MRSSISFYGGILSAFKDHGVDYMYYYAEYALYCVKSAQRSNIRRPLAVLLWKRSAYSKGLLRTYWIFLHIYIEVIDVLELLCWIWDVGNEYVEQHLKLISNVLFGLRDVEAESGVWSWKLCRKCWNTMKSIRNSSGRKWRRDGVVVRYVCIRAPVLDARLCNCPRTSVLFEMGSRRHRYNEEIWKCCCETAMSIGWLC